MSSLLRDALDLSVQDQERRAAEREAASIEDMGAIRRSYHATRIGTDINANNIDEAALRSAQRYQEVDELAERTKALQQRQSMYAPEIDRVEDIGSKNGYLRDGLSWFGTQVGSGVGSMQDPAAVAAAGTALGRVPGLRGVAPLTGMAGAYMLNQRQMAGEHYGRLKEDPQALRNLGDQGAYQQSNLVGVAGGALDTLLPGMAGRALGGAALRGAGGMLGRNTGAKIVGGMAMEGGTELGQGEIGRLAHSYANAGRDTSGDWSDRLNEGAGGAAGGSPFSAAGALADRAYGQTARVGEVVREKAGEVRDLTREQAGVAAEKGKQAYEDSGIKGVIDLGLEKGRSVFESASKAGKAVQDYMRDAQGKINYPEAVAKAQRDYENFKMSQQEADLLQAFAPPDLPPDQAQAWADQHYATRIDYLAPKLAELENAGVSEVTPMLDAITGDDPVAQAQAVDTASEFLLERNKAAQLGRRNALFQAYLAKFIQGGARHAVRGAKAAGDAAAFTGLNAAEGVRQGLSGKKNMQGAGELQMLDYDTWTAMQAENRLVKTGHAVQDAVQAQQVQAVNPVTAQQAASMAELVVAQAIPRARTLGVVGTQEDVQGYSNYVRSLAYELADMAASWQGPQNERPSAEDNHRVAMQIGKLNDLAADLKVVLGDDAPAVVARMTQTMEPMSGPFFDYIQERLAAPQEADTTLQDQLVGLLPQQHQAELREGDGASQLLDMVHQIARGRVPQSKRAEVEEAFGRDVLDRMVELVSGGAFDPTANGQASAVDVSRFAEVGDGTSGAIDTADAANAVETGEVSARDEFEQRQAERSVGFNAGSSGYNFARTGLQSARTPTQRNPDPFAKTKNKQGVERRPTLFRPNSDDSGVGAEALAKKIDDVRKLHEGASGALDVKVKTLAEVFTDLNYNEQQQLTLFADYLRQEGIATNAEAKANTVMGVIDGRVTDPTTIENVRRAMNRFAQARSVVVTEQGTQRMPTEMSHGTLVSMGRGGDQAMSAIRGEAINNLKLKRGSPEYKQYIAKEVGSANLLEFQSAEGQNLMGRTSDDRSITISADRLVKWVRGRDGYEKREGVKAHEAYLEDLLSGIASVMSSGYTNNTLPAMLGPDGAMHSLADGLPPNLRLGLRKVSSFEGDAPTMAELERLRKERVAEVPFERHLTEVDDKGRVVSDDARENRGYQEEVAEEQDKDWFVAEEDTDGQGKDNQTPLDVTKDERYGNAKTEREDLADRSIRKVTDLAGTFGDLDDPQSLISNSGQHAIAETARLRKNREAAEAREREVRENIRRKQQTAKAAEGAPAAAPAPAAAAPATAAPAHAIAQTAAQRSKGVVTKLDKVGMQKVRDATERAMDIVLDAEHQRAIEPVDVDKLQKIVSWSKDQRDFIRQEMAKVKEGSDRWEELAELNDFDYVIDRGEAYLKQNAAPEVAAAEAPKSSSPQGGGEGHKPNARGTARGPSAMSTVLMDMASGGKSARDMLRFVGKNSRSPFNRQLASALLKAGVTPGIEVRDLAAPEGRKVVHGAYDHRRDRVVLAHSAIQNAEQVFMHEMIHAATVKALNANTPAAQELKAMYRHIKKLGVVTEHYAMQDVKEFVAEAFTSPTFQQLLRDIPAPQASDGTIMGWLGRVVRGILGIPAEHKSAMDALLVLGTATMREDSALRRATNAALGATTEAPKPSSPRSGAQPSGTNETSKYNKQGAGKYEGRKSGPTARQGSGVATDAEVQTAKNYLDRVLGDQIKAEFQEITGYSGEWIESENLIRVSTLTTAGIQDVTRHEALHAFFSKFIAANPKAVNVFKSLTDDPRVMRRLEALLKDEPAALEQLADGEERLAYIYQFAMAGLLKLPHTPGTTLMHKIRKFLRRVFQMVSDQERAVDLLYAFERGDMRTPNAAARAIAKNLDQGTWMTKGARMMDGVTQRAAALTLPANVILSNSASPTARKVGLMMFTNPGEEGAVGAAGKTGYLNDRNQQMRQYDNLFRGVIKDLDKRQMGELIEAMQNEVPADDLRDPDVARAKESLHTLFERFHRYMTDEKGLRMGKIKKDYFPVVWDASKLADDPKAFKGMLLEKYSDVLTDMAAKWEEARQRMLAETSPEVLAFMKKMGLNDKPVTPEFVADTLYDRLTSSEGVDDSAVSTPLRQDGVIRPWAAATEVRSLNFIKPEDRAPFLEKDLVKTLSRYVRQGVRTAEYSSRFGREGAVLDRHLKTIKKELETASKEMLSSGDLKDEKARAKWVERQYRDVANAIGAMEGTLGSDASNMVRKINSWSIVYQNVRLLPLALFSSFVDPLGIVARGGEMREAWTTFMDGMRGVARQWGDMMREEPAQRQKDKWEELAEFAGVIDAATFSHLLSDEYASVYLDGTAKKINEVMFKANGMEAWNRAMRVGATRAAVRFMERHNKNPSEHSRRWMADLGFKVGGLPLDGDGQLIVDKRVMLAMHPEMTMDEAEMLIGQVHKAINRWAEGAILSPNAAQRPAWGSDPHFSMFWHLKQFAYSFHETIMKRALNEARHGNVMPLGVFAWYIPTMIAADATKGLMLGAGELPGYMKNYDLGDWILHGADRSGVLGIGHVGIDTVQDPTSVAGPMAEQFADFFVEPMEKNIVHALPANSLYSRALM